jgi:hypothetical protein
MSNRHLFAFSTFLFAVACQGDDVASPSTASEDLQSAEASALVVESGSEASYVSSMLGASAALSLSLEGHELATAPAAVIDELKTRLAAGFADAACLTVATDGATYVDLTFDACTGPGGRLVVDGALHADLSIETRACGPAQCPSAIVYAVSTDGLSVNATTIDGAWQVRDPLAAGPSEWDGSLSIQGPRGSFTSASSASFTVDGACVTYSYDATMTGPRGRTLTIAGDEITRCLDTCPSAGSVVVTGSAGGTLSWTYDGSDVVTATGGAGASIDVELRCGA